MSWSVKFLAAAILLPLALASVLPAESTGTVEPPLRPASPILLGQGDASVAGAHGFEALWCNPAAFASPKREVSLLNSSAWIYADAGRFGELLGRAGSQNLQEFVNGEIASGGFGFGFSSGLGIVGKGLGLGALLNVDSYLYGDTPAAAQGDIHATLAFIAGLALPVKLFGIKLTFGADFKPMVRIRAPLDQATAYEVFHSFLNGEDFLHPLSGVEALHGWGFGVDLGLLAELGRVKIGATAQDFLGTRFTYSQHTVGDIFSSLQESFSLPSGGDPITDHRIPMVISLGASYQPELAGLKGWLEPVFNFELRDLGAVLKGERSPWSAAHFGVELGLVSALKLRAGLNGGYYCLGAGLKLAILELNWAWFTREMGDGPADRPNPGLAVNAAIRF